MSVRVQEIIHRFEVGAGARVIQFVVLILVVLGLAVTYDSIAFRNFSTQEAMDTAQLGRNLAEGKGFTTQFIRPFSLFLLSRQQAKSSGSTAVATNAVRLPSNHPDLSNGPVYPALLALIHLINPSKDPDLSQEQSFSIYWPDLWIGMFNQALLALAAIMVFNVAKSLFDAPVAWVSSILFLLTEVFWRFSVSGLSTILLIVIVLALAGILVRIEKAAGESSVAEAAEVSGSSETIAAPRSSATLVTLSITAGALVGLAAMTRYSMGWLIVPLLIMLGSLAVRQRVLLVIAALGAFVVVMAPWTARNIQLSGTPFGTAGFAIMETTSLFPEHHLERSLHPPIGRVDASEYVRKLTTNLREIVINDLPRVGGNWISALFLAGLLVPFRNPVLGRMRLFLLLSIAVLAVAQALGRTSLWQDSPEINSENLLVVLAPLLFIYGVSLFFILREQLNLIGPAARAVVWVAFYTIAAAPLLLTILAPHPSPVVFPPYYPPWIEQKSRVVGQDETIMADIPWAVAWYGNRPSVWLSLKLTDKTTLADDFNAIDQVRKIHGLYLTGRFLKTIDIKSIADWSKSDAPDSEWERLRKMITDLGQGLLDDSAKQVRVEQLRSVYSAIERNWVRGGGGDWESFVLGIFVKREVPSGFPLQRAIGGINPEIFLTEAPSDGSKSK